MLRPSWTARRLAPALAWAACLIGLVVGSASARGAEPEKATKDAAAPMKPFELKDGDRVVFVGGTFMEREAQLGYIETMLTSRFPDRNVTFRNLGYAGDTVGVEARRICQGWATFGGPDEGFNRLKKLIEEIKPTVVIAGYGMGESFAGEAGLPDFVAKYNRLLDMLTTAGGLPKEQVRVVLLSPTYHEKLDPPLPDPAKHDQDLEKYCHAIKGIATEHGFRYTDLFHLLANADEYSGVLSNARHTSDGIQLTAFGYWIVAHHLSNALDFDGGGRISLDASGHPHDLAGMKVKRLNPEGHVLAFSSTPQRLPFPPLPHDAPEKFASAHRKLGQGYPAISITDLPPGNYALKVGDAVVASAKAEDWRQEQLVWPSSGRDQAEQLRKLIVAKNAEFFNYWRPENDTYILGYRKGEQGRNAVELPQFKPLVEAKEKQIAELRVPKPVTYTLEKK